MTKIIIGLLLMLFPLSIKADSFACYVCGSSSQGAKRVWSDKAPGANCTLQPNITSSNDCLVYNDEGQFCYKCRTTNGITNYTWYTTPPTDSSCVLDSAILSKESCMAANSAGKACYYCENTAGGEYVWTEKTKVNSNCSIKTNLLNENLCLSKNTGKEKCFECATDRGHSFIWSKVNPSTGTCTIRTESTSKTTCVSNNTVLSGEFGKILDEAFNIIRVVGVGMVLVLSSLDFFKGMLEGDQETMKKASNSAFKRLVYAVIIFFLPAIIDIIISLVDGIGGTGF